MMVPILCQGIVYTAAGDGNPWLNEPYAFRIFLARGMDGISVRMLRHFEQSAQSQRATYYDFGNQGNMEAYGSETPPDIPYENINIPVTMFSGTEDDIADPEDMAWFEERIGDNVVSHQTYYMSHQSFAIGVDTSYLEDVYEAYRAYPVARA